MLLLSSVDFLSWGCFLPSILLLGLAGIVVGGCLLGGLSPGWACEELSLLVLVSVLGGAG